MDRRRAAAALLALAACIACSAAAPTAGNHTALELHDDSIEGCYYNFQHYGEGDRIMTNEPCLNCTCHNRMLMCYLRVCPFTKAIGQDCTVEKRADQCCPIVTCPDVPVDLLTSTSTSSPAEYGTTGLGKLAKYGCSIHGKYFPEGSKVPPTPNKPCEHCYCIRNMTTCVMQECTLHVDGCTPIYHKDVCCPVRYSCDHSEDEIPLLDDMTTTVRPTPGFLLTTTTILPITQMSQDCVHDDQIFPDGALIKTEKACEHCYCMKGDIVCVVQECGTPMENEGKNCKSLPPRHGQCCPDTYICEGDEHVIDSTTEIVELTTSPPRRVGVEGSGYRNEPDEPYTEMSPITTEIEGSGEDFVTVPQIDMVENLPPEKVSPEIIDETLLTTTETGLLVSQSTEPDRGLNTIPDSMIDKETAQEPIQNKVTLSGTDEPVMTTSEDHVTVGYPTSRKDEVVTTESSFRKDDDNISDEMSTAKEYEKATTISADELGTITFEDEHVSYTSPKIIEHLEPDEKATTPSIEFTSKVQETSEPEEISTEISVQSSVTDKTKFADEYPISPEMETSDSITTIPATNVVVTETTLNPIINEIDDKVSTISSPSRIPGEGDCLLNGITYTNNTSVPSRNNCHTGCKCISSIIKCDPIICSPPPEYMENMNDCQPVYDTPDSCCPTYVCTVKETIPPQSHSHMSGTESPKPIEASGCTGNDCIVSEEIKPHDEPPTTCKSGNCLNETPTIQTACESIDCKDQEEISPSKHPDCSNGNCQLTPVESCEGENCKIGSSQESINKEDLEPSSHDPDKVSPSKPSEDCPKGNCQILPVIPCEGKDCGVEALEQTVTKGELEPSPHDQIQESPLKPSEDCSNESCRISPIIPCEGENCKVEPSKEELEPSSHDQDQTSPLKPSEECSNGSCQTLPVIPCEGEKCKTESSEETVTKDELEPSSHDQGQESQSKPSEDCSNGNCLISSILPCEGQTCKTEPPKEIEAEKDLEPSSHDEQLNEQQECAGENCRTNEYPDEEANLPTGCIGSDCTLHDKISPIPSIGEQSTEMTTEKMFIEKSTQIAINDENLQNTVFIEPHITTSKEKLTESNLEVTKKPFIDTETPEKLSTSDDQTVTELSDTEKDFLGTEVPIIQTATAEEHEETVTKIDAPQTDSPTLLDTDTTSERETINIASPQYQETYTLPDEVLTTETDLLQTKPPKYLETKPEKPFTVEYEQLTTKTPHDYTDFEIYGTIPNEIYTKLPEITVTESELTQTESSEHIATEKEKFETQPVEIKTTSPEILVTEKETIDSETTEGPFTNMESIQTKLPDVLVPEKEIQSVTPQVVTEMEEIGTKIPELIVTEQELIQAAVTETFTEGKEKEMEETGTEVPELLVTEKGLAHTEVTETFTKQQDTQTKAPETFVTEKEAYETEVPKDAKTPEIEVIIKEPIPTEGSDAMYTVPETIQTESPQSAITSKELIKTETQEPEVTETQKTQTQTETPEVLVTKTEEIKIVAPEIVTEKEDIQTGVSDRYEIKLETTTIPEFDTVQEQTTTNVISEVDITKPVLVPEESITKPQDTPDMKPETSDKEKVYDEAHKAKPEEPGDIKTEDKIEVATEGLEYYTPHETETDMLSETEHSVYDVTKPEHISVDIYRDISKSTDIPTLPESESTTKILITESQDKYTKSPLDLITKSEEKEITTADEELLYTSSPDKHRTKSDGLSQSTSQFVTESQTLIKDKFKESTVTDTESTLLPISEITEKQEEYTETPETYATISETPDKTTKLPELLATLAEETLITHKNVEKQYPSTTIASEKGFDDQKDVNVPDKIHITTPGSIQEELTIIDSNTELDVPVTESSQQQLSTDLKLDSDSPDLAVTIQESGKTSEASTDNSNIITEITTTHSGYPVVPDEKEQDVTPEIQEEDFSMVTKYPTKDTTKEELLTEQQHTASQEYSVVDKEVTDSYIETSTKTLTEDKKQHNIPEIEIQKDTEEEIRDEQTTASTQTAPKIEGQVTTETITKEKQSTLKPPTTQDTDHSELELTTSLGMTSEPEIVTQTNIIDVANSVKDDGTETPYDTEKEVSKPLSPEEKPAGPEKTTEEAGLQESHLPEYTAMDSITTQSSSEISTEKVLINVETTDKNIHGFSEISTTEPELITISEFNTIDLKDVKVTTESNIYTISEDIDKLPTTDNKEIQKEQEPHTDSFFTTSLSTQPEDYKITELPMSLVTNVDNSQSPQTTIFDKGEIERETEKLPDELESEEEKKQTSIPELFTTDIQKQSTEVPEHHVTPEQLETESPSKIKTESSNTLATHYAEKTTPSIAEEVDNIDQKSTAFSIKQTDTVKDLTTVATISNIDMQNTEGTSVADIEEVLIDTQQQKTTTMSSIEKEPDHSHEYQTPLNESDEIVTKSPHEEYTALDEITQTPSKLLEIEQDKEFVSTEKALTEQQELITINPETNIYDVHTTSPGTEISVTKELEEIETPKSSTEKEPEAGTSVYAPIVTKQTEKPMPVVTENVEFDITEQYLKPTEIVVQSEEETTPHAPLQVVTDKENLYTQSIPLSESTEASTQQKESGTVASDGLGVSEEVFTSTQSLLTELSEHDVTTGDLDQEKVDEHVSLHGTTQLPEITSLLTETQTDKSGIDEKSISTIMTPRPTIIIDKEAESQPETPSTVLTIEKETFTTEPIRDLSIQTEKEEILTDVHIPTEFTPLITSGSTGEESQSTQAHKESDVPEGPKETTELEHEFSETTPFLVELKEHTHQVVDESSRTPFEEEMTTAHYLPQQTERGDQDLDITEKYEDEYQTSVPIKDTQHYYEDKEKPFTNIIEQTDQKVPTTTSIIKDLTEPESNAETVSTPSSMHFETDLKEEEEKLTSLVQDLTVSTSLSPQPLSDKESYTTISTDTQKSTYQKHEPSEESTEKNIYLEPEEPLKSETPFGTTLSDEHLVHETSKATTSMIKEETSTQSPSTIAKSPEAEEKPVVPTLAPTQEVIKPGFDEEINEGVPSPDFPPSGSGGYGQEPDYVEEDQAFGPGTCRYGGKVYVSAQQIPRDDPCDFCFCFRSDIICLQQSCPPPIHGCHEEPIQGFCCPRYECPVSMATTVNVTTTTTTTTTTLPPHFLPHAYKGAAQRRGCQIKGHTYKVGEVVRASSGPCLHCTCGGDGQMKCDPKACTPEPMLRQMIAAAVSAKRRR